MKPGQDAAEAIAEFDRALGHQGLMVPKLGSFMPDPSHDTATTST
jgi:hypothetical protein